MIQTLTPTEASILVKGYGSHQIESDFIEVVKNIREKQGFIRCLCLGEVENAPLLGTRKLDSNQIILVNLPGKREHAGSCALHYNKAANASKASLEDTPCFSEVAYLKNERVQFDTKKLSQVLRHCMHAAKLNSVINTPIGRYEIEELLQDTFNTHSSFRSLQGRVVVGLDMIQPALKELKSSDEFDFKIVVGSITDYDNNVICRQFGTKKPYRVAAGKVFSTGNTNQGPFMATVLLAGHKGQSFAVGTHVEPIFSLDQPIPIRSAEVRELVASLMEGQNSLIKWIENVSGERPEVFLPVKSAISPLSNEKFMATIEIRCNGVSVFISDPEKEDRGRYNESGYLIWHRHLSVYPKYRSQEITKLKSRIAGAILSNANLAQFK